MSKVKSYTAYALSGPAGDVMKSSCGRTVYFAADFDRVTAERDALRNEVGQVKGEYDRAVNKVDALQVLLTTGDEENDALKHWRDLALQFDNHRMKALWHLKTLVSDGAHYDAAAAFLAEPPIPASELQQRLTAADERADVLETVSVKQAALLDELGIPLDEVDDLFGETLKNAKRYEYLRSVMAVENFPTPHPEWSEPLESESKRIDDLCDAAIKP